MGIVADNFEYPATDRPQIEIQTKVDHLAALTGTNADTSNSHRWLRVHLRDTQPGPTLENVIAIIHRANLRGMKVIANVTTHGEDFDERSEFMADLRGTSLDADIPWLSSYRFSKISPEKFRSRLVRMLKAFRKNKLHVDAFEIGNELDWGAFNGDLVNRDGTAATLVALQLAVGKYAEIFKIAHKLIRKDDTFNKAKLVTFGFANPDQGYLTRPRSAGGLGMDPHKLPILPAEVCFGELQGRPYWFEGEVRQPLHREDILSKFADGIGLHVYSDDDSGSVLQRFADIVRPSGKPLWITEWGYLKNGDHQQDDTRRAKMNLFIRRANELKTPRVETLIYYSYNDNWGLVAPMTAKSDPFVPGVVFDSACKVFQDYVH